MNGFKIKIFLIYLANCEKSDVNKQNCTVNVISSEKTLQMTAEIILDKCHKTKTAAHVRIEIESFKQTYSAYLGWSDHFTIRQNANRSKFYLGSQNVMTSQSGYLPISGGEISLYVKEDSSVPALHVVVYLIVSLFILEQSSYFTRLSFSPFIFELSSELTRFLFLS